MARNRIWAFLIVSSCVTSCFNTGALALELSIIEAGPESNTTIALTVHRLNELTFGVNHLVAPSGDIFEPDSIVSDALGMNILRYFDTVADAFEYVAGTWQATVVPLPLPNPPSTDSYKFEIERIEQDAINREAPTFLTPSPGQIVKNGSTFLLGWDFSDEGDDYKKSKILFSPRFGTSISGYETVIGKPSPSSMVRLSGGGGAGDRKFERELTNVPGTDEYRFLMTLTASEPHLPLDVNFAVGSYVPLRDEITLGDTGDLNIRIPFDLDFHYSRQTETFAITLSSIPEPTTGLLALAGAFIVWLRIRRTHMRGT